MATLLIARLVLLEAARRRLAPVVVVLTICGIALSAWGFNRIAADPSMARGTATLAALVSALVVFMAFMFTNVLALGAALVGANALGAELENGTLLSILPRPVRRAEIFAGKWLGAFGVTALFGACAVGLEIAVLWWQTAYLPPDPGKALLYLFAILAAVTLCAVAFATRLAPLTAAIAAVVLYGAAWIDGVVHAVAIVLNKDTLAQTTLAIGLIFPSDGLWRGVLNALEPAALRAAGLSGPGSAGPFAISGPPTAAFLWWSAVWFVAVALAGHAAFRARDL